MTKVLADIFSFCFGILALVYTVGGLYFLIDIKNEVPEEQFTQYMMIYLAGLIIVSFISMLVSIYDQVSEINEKSNG